MKKLLALFAIATVITLTGCQTVDRWVSSNGTPVATNTVPAVIDPGTGNVIKPEEKVISYDLSPETIAAIKAIGDTGSAFGVPGIELATGTLTTLLGLIYGWSNRRRWQKAAGKVNELETVSVVLVQNVEAMKKLALQYAALLVNNDPDFVDKVNQWANDALTGAQGMAGVEELIRSLVQKHTGDTRQDVGYFPVPLLAPPPA